MKWNLLMNDHFHWSHIDIFLARYLIFSDIIIVNFSCLIISDSTNSGDGMYGMMKGPGGMPGMPGVSTYYNITHLS